MIGMNFIKEDMPKSKILSQQDKYRLVAKFLGYKQSTYDHGKNGIRIIWQDVRDSSRYWGDSELSRFQEDNDELMNLTRVINSLHYSIHIISFCEVSILDQNGKLFVESKYECENINDSMFESFVKFIQKYNKLNETISPTNPNT